MTREHTLLPAPAGLLTPAPLTCLERPGRALGTTWKPTFVGFRFLAGREAGLPFRRHLTHIILCQLAKAKTHRILEQFRTPFRTEEVFHQSLVATGNTLVLIAPQSWGWP